MILALLISLLFLSHKMEYLSFITGLYIGATLIQIYFHRFSEPLPEDKAPKPPISPIKMMSYGIQAFPKKPWKELLFLTIIFLWGIYMLLSKGFGLFWTSTCQQLLLWPKSKVRNLLIFRMKNWFIEHLSKFVIWSPNRRNRNFFTYYNWFFTGWRFFNCLLQIE